MDDMNTSQIKSVQTLSSVAIIASPVSLVFGGVLLSLVALICATIGRSKLNALKGASGVEEPVAKMLTRQNTVGLVVSAAALIINAVAFAFAFNVLMQAVQSGDYSQLTQLLGFDPSAQSPMEPTDAAKDVSVWDA